MRLKPGSRPFWKFHFNYFSACGGNNKWTTTTATKTETASTVPSKWIPVNAYLAVRICSFCFCCWWYYEHDNKNCEKKRNPENSIWFLTVEYRSIFFFSSCFSHAHLLVFNFIYGIQFDWRQPKKKPYKQFL